MHDMWMLILGWVGLCLDAARLAQAATMRRESAANKREPRYRRQMPNNINSFPLHYLWTILSRLKVEIYVFECCIIPSLFFTRLPRLYFANVDTEGSHEEACDHIATNELCVLVSQAADRTPSGPFD